jgi:hypothetical protein
MLNTARDLVKRISFSVLGVDFDIRVHRDFKSPQTGRVYLQVKFTAPCSKTSLYQEWTGRKWYLSDHMTEDEVVKTAYAACKAAIEHEVMEGFKVDGIILFNPHVDFEELLKISHHEIKRAK